MRAALQILPIPFVVLVGTSTQARDTLQSPPADAPVTSMVSTPLRTLGTAEFSPNFFSMGPPRCDADGNMFFVLSPEWSSDHPGGPPPNAILSIRADGKETSRFEPATIPAFAGAFKVMTTSLAIGPDGTRHALVSVGRGNARTQYIVSFDDDGQDGSPVKIDASEISVGHIEVFGSGAFLLVGNRIYTRGQAMAVMPAGGGRLRDVVGLPPTITEGPDPTLRPGPGIARMARAEDGRIYFKAPGEDSVYVINASGDAEYAFELAPLPDDRDLRLTDLKAAGSRMAATYHDEEGGAGARYWIVVYDVILGERVALYGPLSSPPICYTYERSRDRFRRFSGEGIVTASP